jgi:methylenetetrahydrofolate dehydrogenase (NADP+)/methenyltetrahydrofolate cyclohydrolase
MADARIIDGMASAARLRAQVAVSAAAFHARTGAAPGLAVVLTGDDPASHVYVRNKIRQTIEAGMNSIEHRLPADTDQQTLIDTVRALNADPNVHGILVQLPLPNHLDPAPILAEIDPAKDVDGLTIENVGRLSAGLPGLVPCTPRGCMLLLEQAIGDLTGKRALVIGRSALVGRPIAQLLTQANATVTVAHSRTRDLVEECKRAELLIAAVGQAEFVRGDWIQPGAVVIDVGINRIVGAPGEKARLVGDVAFAEAVQVASAITPVPRGVGPMTIACLLTNTLDAAHRANGLLPPAWSLRDEHTQDAVA